MSETNGKTKTSELMIIVGGSADNPYYSIRYYDLSDNEWHVGFSSYELSYVMDWKKQHFEIVEPVEHVEPAKSMGIETNWESEYKSLKEQLDCACKENSQIQDKIKRITDELTKTRNAFEALQQENDFLRGEVEAYAYCLKCLSGKE